MWRWATACLLPSAALMALIIWTAKVTRLTFVLWGVAMVLILALILAVESAED